MSKKYHFNTHKQRKTAINSVIALVLVLFISVSFFMCFVFDVYAQEEITKLGKSIANFGQSVSNIQNTATKFISNQVQNTKEISSNVSNTIKSAINKTFAFCKDKTGKVKNKITNRAIQTKNYLLTSIANLLISSEQTSQQQPKEQLVIVEESVRNTEDIEQVIQVKEIVKQTENIIHTTLLTEIIESADLTQLNKQIDSLSDDIDSLASQISSKIDYTTPSYAPAYVPSSGIQISGHSLLSSLNVAGSGSVGGSLSVKQNFSVGNTKDNITPTFTVYSASTFNNSASFNSGISASSLSVSGDSAITGALTAATSTISQLTITDDLSVGGNATTTGSYYIGGTASTTELFVQGDIHAGGDLTIDGSQTIIGNLNITGYASTTAGLFTQASGHFGQNLTIDGSATTTGSMYIGADLNVVGDMGILDADVPDTITASNYLLLTGGTLTGGLTMLTTTSTNSTSTNLYISNDLTIAGDSSLQKATSTFLYASGDITSDGSFVGNLTGNADTATNLADYSSAYTWTGINTFSSDVRITGSLHATTTDFDLLLVSGSATTTGSLYTGQLSIGSSGSEYWFPSARSNSADYVLKTDINGIMTWQTDSAGEAAWEYDSLAGAMITTSTKGFYMTSSSTIHSNFRVDGNATTTGSFAIGTDKYSVFDIDSNGDLNVDLNTLNATTTFLDNVQIDGNLGGGSPLDIVSGANIMGGNVGIGTTTPKYNLSIESNNATDNLFQIATTTNQTIIVVDNAGYMGINTSTPSYNLDVYGNIRADQQIISSQTDGTTPMLISSQTKVANLNADLLDGFDSSAFGDATAANQTTILARIGTNSDSASMSDTLFAGQQYIADNMGTASNVWTNTTRKLTKPNIECPSDMVYVESNEGGFCIDKYEASPDSNCTHSYSGTGNPADQAETLVNLDDSDCAPQSVSGGAPWISISQGQAALACAKAGKRLPTNKEWFYAALGTPDYDATDPADNSEECHIWNSGSPGNPTGSTYIDHDDDANNAEAIQSGSASSCVSSAGAYDMVGNVWEWVSDSTTDAAGLVTGEVSSADYIDGVDGDGLVREVNDTTPNANYNEDMFWYAAGNRGFVRGGAWGGGAGAGVFTLHLSYAPSGVAASVGFRCAR